MYWCGDNIRMIELSSTLQILSQLRLLVERTRFAEKHQQPCVEK
jgi:hypothetical protein